MYYVSVNIKYKPVPVQRSFHTLDTDYIAESPITLYLHLKSEASHLYDFHRAHFTCRDFLSYVLIMQKSSRDYNQQYFISLLIWFIPLLCDFKFFYCNCASPRASGLYHHQLYLANSVKYYSLLNCVPTLILLPWKQESWLALVATQKFLHRVEWHSDYSDGSGG